MANNVFANGREISCKKADGKAICAFPDVCMTPPENPATPPGVPIPYPNTGMAKDMTSGSKSVKVSDKEVMLKNKSYFKKSIGDEAGCAAKKGVVTSVNKGKVYFISWSMDVKVEGENVVRHLDMTTHNHASPISNTGPWSYADSSVVGPGGDCNIESKALKKAGCKDPVQEDTSKACCGCPQRQCVLVPYDKAGSMCCKKGIETGDYKTTGHHVFPVAAVSHTRSKKWTGRAKKSRRAFPLKGNAKYHENNAPTICAKGKDHDSRYASGDLMEHGLFGNAYCAARDKALDIDGKPLNYETLSEASAEAVEKQTEKKCSAKCIKAQIDSYHKDKIKVVRRSSISPRPKRDRSKARTGSGSVSL